MKLQTTFKALAVAGIAGLGACGDEATTMTRIIEHGDPDRGKSLITSYGCGTCHVIQGVRGTRGKVGPILENYAQQHLLAGFLPNTSPYLIAWLMDPVALNPQTGMPAQGLTENDARHIAAYLYTLGDDNRVYPSEPPLPLRGRDDTMPRLNIPVGAGDDTAPRTFRIAPAKAESTTPE